MAEILSEAGRHKQNQRLVALRNIRQPRYNHWRDIVRYVVPYAGRFMVSERDQAVNRFQDIIDETGAQAVVIVKSSLMSLRTNPSVQWFRSQTPDEELNLYLPVRKWLWGADAMARRIIDKSRSNIALPHLYGETAVFGTGASIVVNDFHKVIRHNLLTAGEFLIATNSHGEVDTLYREFQMSVIELVQEFGEENLSDTAKRLYNGKTRSNWDTLISVVHAIEPRMRAERDGDPRMSKNMPWKSTYFESASTEKKYLRVMGHHSFPCIVPRWEVNGGDFWGEGPGTMALGSVRELQEVQLQKAKVIDYQSDPPVQIPSGMKGKDGDFLPGGRIPYDQNNPNGGVRNAFDVPMRLDYAQSNIDDVRGRINKSFFVDRLQPITDISDTTLRTATEIRQRQAEGLIVLGPVDFRFRDELDNKLLDIIYARMFEENLLPPPPPELNGMPLDIEFMGPLAQALKNSQAMAVSDFRRHLGEIADLTQSTGVLDGYDGDADRDRISDMLGIDPALIVPGEQIALIRQARAETEKAQAQIEAMAVQAKTAKDMAGADTSTQNALTDVMAGISG